MVLRIEDAATEFVTGKVKLIIEKNDGYYDDDIEFNLDITVDDKIKLMNIEKNIQKDKESEVALKDQQKVMRTILERSYKNKDSTWVENTLVKFGDALMLEIYFMWKWRSKQDFKTLEELKKKKIEEMMTNKTSSGLTLPS